MLKMLKAHKEQVIQSLTTKDDLLLRQNEFLRPNEVYGTIIRSQDKGEYLKLLVSDLQGDTESYDEYTVIDSEKNSLLTESLSLGEIQPQENGITKFVLLKQQSQDSLQYNFKPNDILTTNFNTVADYRKIRTAYTDKSVYVYQAFCPEIAQALLSTGKYMEPFSFKRMTWLKTSFLWTMYRSQWGQSSGQTNILSLEIDREYFYQLLKESLLASKVKQSKIISSHSVKRNRVQWDNDRDVDGQKMKRRTLQLGIAPYFLSLLNEGIINIKDLTNIVSTQKLFFPVEYPLPVPYADLELSNIF